MIDMPLKSQELEVLLKEGEALLQAGAESGDRGARVNSIVAAAVADVPGGVPDSGAVASAFSNWTVRRWVAYSGAIVVVYIGAAYIFKRLPEFRPILRRAATEKTYATAPGQRAKVILTSGAQVTLAPSTTISVTGNEVILDGQAVFTVLHNRHVPFTVRANHALVKVLGTTFSVRSYQNDNATRVVVAEGRVVANQAVLSVSDAADISSSGTRVRHGTDITPEFAWTEGRLVFNDTPLSEVARQLERWYNVKIDIADAALESSPVTNTFFQQSLTSSELDLFSQSLGIRYKRSGNHITFFEGIY